MDITDPKALLPCTCAGKDQFLNDYHFPTCAACHRPAIATALAEARSNALEEAARIAETEPNNWGGTTAGLEHAYEVGANIAIAIRAAAQAQASTMPSEEKG